MKDGKFVVLCIDDDQDVVDMLRQNLQEAGYAVIGAQYGQEGLKKVRQLQPVAVTPIYVSSYRDSMMSSVSSVLLVRMI